MQQHVHAADAEHGVVEVEAVEHLVVEVLPEASRREASPGGAARRYSPAAIRKPQVPQAGSQMTSVGRRRNHLHHELDDVARRAELTVLPGRGDLGEHVLVEVALGVAVLHRDLVDEVDDLGKQLRGGDGEAGVLHVVRVGRAVAAECPEEREDVLARRP